MALLKTTTRTAREPDEVVSLGRIGVAVWSQPKSLDHDVKFGRHFAAKNGGKAVVGTTTPLSLTDELLEAQGRVYAQLAAGETVPAELKVALAEFGKRLPELVADVRRMLAASSPSNLNIAGGNVNGDEGSGIFATQ